MEWKDFILAHEGDDPARLVLSRDRYPGVDVALAAATLESRRKLQGKVPEWYAEPGLILPRRLSAEQCSSTVTARYKAALAASVCPGSARMADLTGGLGVDSWAFSEVFGEVLYNEMDPQLSDVARHNFALLRRGNITVRCHKVGETPLAEILDGFVPDILFLDPARRDGAGKKVFLLEDCSPDVTGLLADLYAAAPHILLKLSPMADIAMLLERLPGVKELHILSVKGECKELLLLLERGWTEEAVIVADGFRFRRSEEASAVASFALPEAGGVLFEPGKSLMKAGCFKLLSERTGMRAVGAGSHLYLAQDEDLPRLKEMGKCFRILEVLPLDKRSMAAAGKKYSGADVSARGVKMTSEQLRGRLGPVKAGEEGLHIWGLHADSAAKNILLATRRIL